MSDPPEGKAWWWSLDEATSSVGDGGSSRAQAVEHADCAVSDRDCDKSGRNLRGEVTTFAIGGGGRLEALEAEGLWILEVEGREGGRFREETDIC